MRAGFYRYFEFFQSLSHVLHQVILSRVRVPVFNSSMIESIQNVIFSQTCYSTNRNARYMIKLFKEINILHIKISKPRNSDPPSVPGYHGFELHTRHSQSSLKMGKQISNLQHLFTTLNFGTFKVSEPLRKNCFNFCKKWYQLQVHNFCFHNFFFKLGITEPVFYFVNTRSILNEI